MGMPNRIECCGGIASGKTTFARLLEKIEIAPVAENFQENPFWQLFYADPNRFAFETEISFLLQHYNLIKRSVSRAKVTAFDYSLLLDRAYADVTLSDSQRSVFTAVFDHVLRELGPPRLIIYLLCCAEEERRRIRNRKREVEQNIRIEYLQAINDAVAYRIEEVSTQFAVLRINSEQFNFAEDESAKSVVIRMVQDALAI